MEHRSKRKNLKSGVTAIDDEVVLKKRRLPSAKEKTGENIKTKVPKNTLPAIDPYVCYILQSLVNPKRSYVGITNDLAKRVRQHNGEIKNGAKATRAFKPYIVCAVVVGFCSRSDAQQFEWSMHHPRQRQIPTPHKQFAGRMNVVQELLNQKPWRDRFAAHLGVVKTSRFFKEKPLKSFRLAMARGVNVLHKDKKLWLLQSNEKCLSQFDFINFIDTSI